MGPERDRGAGVELRGDRVGRFEQVFRSDDGRGEAVVEGEQGDLLCHGAWRSRRVFRRDCHFPRRVTRKIIRSGALDKRRASSTMSENYNVSLIIGAGLSAIAALLHVGIVIGGAAW